MRYNWWGITDHWGITDISSPSVPQLSYLNVTALGNQSLLVSWQLQYDGGWPVTSLNITVEALDSSPAPVRAEGYWKASTSDILPVGEY